MAELIEPQICDYGNVNMLTHQITTKVLLLNGEDLSQLLQSLISRIKALETKHPHAEETEPLLEEPKLVPHEEAIEPLTDGTVIV